MPFDRPIPERAGPRLASRRGGTSAADMQPLPGESVSVLLFPQSGPPGASLVQSVGASDATHDASAELSQLRSELESAREEVVFLREQLHSAKRFHDHCLDEERARLRAARAVLVRELGALVQALQRQGQESGLPPEHEREQITIAELGSERSESR